MWSSISEPMRAWLGRFGIALAVTGALTVLGLGGSTWYLEHKFNQATSVEVDLDDQLSKAMNFLILGSDSRAFVESDADKGSFGDENVVGGQRADAMIIARVEPRDHQGILVSFPRDLLVKNQQGASRRINEAFTGGPQGVVDVIRRNFGIPIHHYLELDFSGFRTMVDAIGGVSMYIASPVRDRKTGLDLPTAGCVVLDGRQALAWVRSRAFTYLDGERWRTDPTGDIGRIERQQQFIRRLMSQAISKGAFNPLRATRLADAALDNMKVDSTFKVRDALRLLRAFRRVGPKGVEMLVLPTKGASAGRLRPSDAAEPIVARLRGDLTPGEDSAKVTPASVRLRVLNGNGVAGSAGEATSTLSAAGFTTAQPGNVSPVMARTEIRYRPASEAKARYLARYLKRPARLVADSRLGDVDVALVLGRDFAGLNKKPGPERAVPASATTTTAPPAAASAPTAPPAATGTPQSEVPPQPTC